MGKSSYDDATLAAHFMPIDRALWSDPTLGPVLVELERADPVAVDDGAWMKATLAALRFDAVAEFVIGFIVKLRDLNTELARQIANHRRRRPSSETLARLERQLALAFPEVVAPVPKPKTEAEGTKKKSRRGEHPGRDALPADLPRIPDRNSVPAFLEISSETWDSDLPEQRTRRSPQTFGKPPTLPPDA